MEDHTDAAPDDLAPYPNHVTTPTSPEETRALVHALVETLPDDLVDALCRLLAWCCWSGAGSDALGETSKSMDKGSPVVVTVE